MASKKTKSPMDAASLNKKTVATLKTLCKKLGITCSGTKAQHIDAILMSGAEGIKEIKIPTKGTKNSSPSSSSPLSPPYVSSVRGKGAKGLGGLGKVKLVLEIPTASPGKCKSNEVREVTVGKCIKKTQKGEPFGSAALKKKYGDDYVFDAKLGIVGRKADVEAYRADHSSPRSAKSPVKKAKSPAKKASTKKAKAKSPAKKKTTVKKAPAKKKSPAKKAKAKTSPKKATTPKSKTCVDKEDPVICKDEEICSAPSGRCIKDTKINRHGSKGDKAELNVDGRVIVGTVATITKLEKILGGTITLPGKKTPAKKAKTPAKKAPSKKAKASPKKVKASPKKVSPKVSPSEDDSSEEKPKKKTPAKKAKTPAKKAKTPAKKAKTPAKKAKSPQTLEAVEKRLDQLLEEGGNDTEIEALKEKLTKLKAGKKSPGTKSKAKPGKVEMKEQELYKTFMGCLSSLSAE